MWVLLNTSCCVMVRNPTWFGSIVQKGKFSAGMPILVSTLNSVLLPTLGMPTIPICMGTADHVRAATAAVVLLLPGDRDGPTMSSWRLTQSNGHHIAVQNDQHHPRRLGYHPGDGDG